MEGIERVRAVSKLIFGALREVCGVQDSKVRGFGIIVDFDDFRAETGFVQELGGRQEKVVEEPPLSRVEIVEELDQLGILEALVTQPLTDMGPVLLLDMGVVVLFVGSGSGELDRWGSVLEVSDQMPLDEFGAVVAVEAEDGEWQGNLDGDDLLQDTAFSLAPDCTLLGPSGGDVGDIEGEGELTGHGIAAMSHGIGFEEARPCLIPLVGFDGNVVLEQRAGLGGGEAFALNTQPLVCKQPVDGGWGYLGQRLLDPGRQHSKGLLVRLDPAVQDGSETLGAGIVHGLPDAMQHRDNLRFVIA